MVADFSPRAVYTSGKASSAAGTDLQVFVDLFKENFEYLQMEKNNKKMVQLRFRFLYRILNSSVTKYFSRQFILLVTAKKY